MGEDREDQRTIWIVPCKKRERERILTAVVSFLFFYFKKKEREVRVIITYRSFDFDCGVMLIPIKFFTLN